MACIVNISLSESRHDFDEILGKRAVDALLESEFVKRDEPLFKTRDEIVDYLHVMLEHKFYHRARKVPVSESELKSKKKEKKSVEPVEEEKKEKDKGTDAESSVVEGAKESQVCFFSTTEMQTKIHVSSFSPIRKKRNVRRKSGWTCITISGLWIP